MSGTLFFWTCRVAITLAVSLIGGPSFAETPDFDEQLKQVAHELAKEAKRHRLHRVVVEPFTDLDGAVTPLGRFLADELATELVAGRAVEVMDRQQLIIHLQKRKTERLSTLPKADLEKAGRVLGLDGVVAGSVVESANQLRLTAKLIATRSASLVAAAKATLPRTGFLAELASPSGRPRLPELKPEAAPVQADENQPPEGMILIPAGPFIFGEGDGRQTVALSTFWMDLFEVTNGRYAELRAIEYAPLKSHHPVTGVSWHHARQFCLAKGKRLPTEQEWEKAARGTDGRLYPWGDVYESTHVNGENRLGGSTSVGQFEQGRSPYGLYDMAGNVMEWTDSGDTEAKIFRGGSWASPPQDLRTTSRSSIGSAHRLVDLGFRCAKDGPMER